MKCIVFNIPLRSYFMVAAMSTVVGYDAWTPEPDKKMVSLERIPSELRDGETPP